MDFVRSTSIEMNLWPVEHFCFPFWIWKKGGTKVFNWSEVHFYRSNFLQNPYFTTLAERKTNDLSFSSLIDFFTSFSDEGYAERSKLNNVEWEASLFKNIIHKIILFNICIIVIHETKKGGRNALFSTKRGIEIPPFSLLTRHV